MIKEAGFSGVQDGDAQLCTNNGLRITAQHRVNKIGDLDQKIIEWKSSLMDCATVHVGWGMEDDDEANRLVEYVLSTSEKNDFPIYIETHRATITQDIWRTVQIVKRFPEVRFNGDFSHWYTGLEMVNGDFDEKLSFIEPVLSRVRFMHGRIGNPGCIQVSIDRSDKSPYVEHFKEMWKRSFKGFLTSAVPGDFLCFTPELLSPEYYYAQVVNESGRVFEKNDRWTQALLLCEIARECWEEVTIGK
ncbi:MAG: hypothetical protein RIC35_20145 [Marinoscillum sp.]